MKMTSKSGCVCQLASLETEATTTPNLGTASQVRCRDSRRRRAWSVWGSSSQVSTGHYPPSSQVLLREALFCPKCGQVNMALEGLQAPSPFRLS